jgi:hypothetical protein
MKLRNVFDIEKWVTIYCDNKWYILTPEARQAAEDIALQFFDNGEYPNDPEMFYLQRATCKNGEATGIYELVSAVGLATTLVNYL